MAITRLQSTAVPTANVSSFPITYASPLTAGSYLVVFATAYDNGANGGLGVSDSAGHTWTPIVAEQQSVGFPVYGRAWIAPNAGTATPTVTFTGANYWWGVVIEYSGVHATTQIDATPTVGTGTGTTSPNTVASGTHTPVTNGNMRVSFWGGHYEAAPDITSVTVPSGWNSIATETRWATAGIGGAADLTQATAAGFNASWSIAKPNASNMQWYCIAFALRPAAGGGGVTGTIVYTDDADTLVAAGKSTHVGTVAVTDATDTMVAAGNLPRSATIAWTDATDTLAASGTSVHVGTVSYTDETDTMSAAGQLPRSATVAWTDDNDTLTGAGTSVHVGTIVYSDDNDTVAAVATVGHHATIAWADDDDIMLAAGSGVFAGTIAWTDADDQLVAAAVRGHVGTIVWTDADDVMTSSTDVPIVPVLSISTTVTTTRAATTLATATATSTVRTLEFATTITPEGHQ